MRNPATSCSSFFKQNAAIKDLTEQLEAAQAADSDLQGEHSQIISSAATSSPTPKASNPPSAILKASNPCNHCEFVDVPCVPCRERRKRSSTSWNAKIYLWPRRTMIRPADSVVLLRGSDSPTSWPNQQRNALDGSIVC